jgi:16S rRNA (cytosine967-C5)-methyltransferase
MNARDFALFELDAKTLPGWTRNLLAKRRRQVNPPNDPRDLGLAEQIIVGVIKNLALLHFLIERHAQRPIGEIDPLALKILAIGLYQIHFLDRIPVSAAVNEAVEQCKRFGLHRAAGFVNAVLRRADRHRDESLPTREQSPERYAEIVLSHPPELFSRLKALMGEDDAIRFCEHDNAEPPTIVRLISGASPTDLDDPLVQITPHEQSGMYVVFGAKRDLLARWSSHGIAQVQDPTSALVVDHLDIHGGNETQNILDRCAGLGTKTMQIAERLGPNGNVVAIDPNRTRCEGLKKVAAERGLINKVFVFNKAWMREVTGAGGMSNSFHRVLIDAPCSNSGVLARRPEARYAQDDKTLTSLRELQLKILDDTAPYLCPNGLLVYSTCSIWPEENQEVVKIFMASHPDFQKLSEMVTLPSFDPDPSRYRDGGYFAVLGKINH